MKVSEIPNKQIEDMVWCGRLAAEDLVAFSRLTSPDPGSPNDVLKSRFEVKPHHNLIASRLMDVESGLCKRLLLVLPPRHGKTELAIRKFVPWFVGRNPERSVIVSTYSDTFSSDHGRSVRDVMSGPGYRLAFGKQSRLRTDSQAADRLQTTAGGLLAFVGRGGSITGRGADLFVIDDPIKDSEESGSQLIRDKLWTWFAEVVMTRLMSDAGAIVVIQTRWHEDDLVGRLTDPANPHYSKEEATRWTVVRLPAVAEGGDALGRKAGESLWPERFSEAYLSEVRNLSPRGFSALWQGNPTPAEGSFFKSQWLSTYQPGELPGNLRRYVASDHAVSTRQENDRTCLLPVGVGEDGTIWVLPDVWWDRGDSMEVTEQMLSMMRRLKPLMWFAEKGHISQSIGPFLRKRMLEERVFVSIDEVTPTKDKLSRAQSIQGRCSMGRVRFPAFAPWWADALAELLQFPNGAHDDFVDALAHVGMGLDSMVEAQGPATWKEFAPRTGTLAWVKQSAGDMRRLEAVARGSEGF